MSTVVDAASVTRRLQRMGRLSDLRVERRLLAKVDYSAAAVTRRLRTVSSLRAACLRWVAIGRSNGLGSGDRT